MKFGVVVFPGSNCDQDMFYAFDQILGQPTEYLWHKREELNDYEQDDVILVPGGFSYGDYLRAGAIARFSPIMKSVIQFAERGGKVLGVCNGFQILCETGLLPGTLLRNRHQKFISKNVFIKKNSDSLLTGELDENEVLKIPIAHAEGRYFAKEKELQDLVDNNQILFQYCDKKGQITEEANPNGSLLNIAGICNKNGNVFGMMPHPERAVDPALFNEDGVKILAALGHAKQQQLS
ncbi:MAG TPA: phosphoribosylformylglycinamidine synthase I [Saprospiraceae bacterium]|nr:phosphoribosylformylglycinamidine synthase I [Saprospiraceae bacterium]